MNTHLFGPPDADISPTELERTRQRLNLAWALAHPELVDQVRLHQVVQRLEEPPVLVTEKETR